ncbi:MAG: SMP-30/gluconolactonase/LRE family protein [Burkholderiales bacterium]|nr:SMP-30/gluconolactonase/LRE family protein [Burkholderiales bacterium]
MPLDSRDLLGESPVWDAREQALYWVDTRGRRIRRWLPSGADAAAAAAPRSWPTPEDVGAIALARPGRILVALAGGFAELDLASGDFTTIASVRHPRPEMRLNDGRTDREGRFVCGSMVLHRRDPEGLLYRLDGDGRVETLLSGIAVANSTAFSPDGRTMYFADSLAGVIRAWDYGRDGSLSGERVFADTRPEGSGPDGAAVDAAGCLWVALVLAGRLACYSPEGRLLHQVSVPVPFPSCPCFGGPDLSTLYVTSIRDSGNVLRSDDPGAGALVAVHGLGVRGLPEVAYAGAPAPTAVVTQR